MKAGKITAKLRDAVPVCFIEDGIEVRQYKNIELPDELKELEIKDFHFNIPLDGKIVFHLIFDKGVLPEAFPPERAKVTMEEKRAAKAARLQNNDTPAQLPAKRCKDGGIGKDTKPDETPANLLVEASTGAPNTAPGKAPKAKTPTSKKK